MGEFGLINNLKVCEGQGPHKFLINNFEILIGIFGQQLIMMVFYVGVM